MEVIGGRRVRDGAFGPVDLGGIGILFGAFNAARIGLGLGSLGPDRLS